MKRSITKWVYLLFSVPPSSLLRMRGRFVLFLATNSGLLCKRLPLLALDKIVEFDENNIDLTTYDDSENLV
jgi:hypothetical protein